MPVLLEDDQIRRAMLHQHCATRRLQLSRREWSTWGYVRRHRRATSRAIAAQYGISLQNATNVLRSLLAKGYLTRRNVGSPTGGHLYEYEVPAVLLHDEEG